MVLGEGRPHTDDRWTPWALNPFFGLFRGWWDIGGFVPRESWLAAFKQAGFSRPVTPCAVPVATTSAE